MLRIGVLGSGVMGAAHIRTLAAEVSGASVSAAFDVDRGRAAEAVSGLDEVRLHADPHALIEDDRVDAVLVASPDATHEEFVLACLAVGKPVLCEKPLAPTVDGCLKIVESERSLGRRLVTVGFMRRYDPGFVELKRLLSDGEVGAALMLHCVHRNPSAMPELPSEVVVTGSAVHEIDLARWLLGSELAFASAHRPRRSSLVWGATQDPQFLVFETADGVIVDVDVFVNAQYGYDVRCELVGERGAVSLGEATPTVLRSDLRAARAVPRDWRDRFADAYRRELQDWVSHAARGGAGGASAWDGYVATAVARTAVAALEDGGRHPVRLADRPAIYG
jgi:myo-inositol 2-dehydrogenase/D-chiro-inositol 1-dehydrogenase